MALQFKCVVETNLISKSELALYKPLFHFNSRLKQVYMSNKMEYFSYT